jgi:hypothetical protein
LAERADFAGLERQGAGDLGRDGTHRMHRLQPADGAGRHLADQERLVDRLPLGPGAFFAADGEEMTKGRRLPGQLHHHPDHPAAGHGSVRITTAGTIKPRSLG